jgi:translocator protein
VKRSLLITSAAVTATAVVGVVGTDVRSRWYARLDKPRWQPPGVVFGPVWTSIYGLTALASARALDRADAPTRHRYATALGVNLVLNVGWPWVFFTAKRPGWALLEVVALELSTLDLARRTRRLDPVAAGLLAPYAVWGGFATALTAEIARRDR